MLKRLLLVGWASSLLQKDNDNSAELMRGSGMQPSQFTGAPVPQVQFRIQMPAAQSPQTLTSQPAGPMPSLAQRDTFPQQGMQEEESPASDETSLQPRQPVVEDDITELSPPPEGLHLTEEASAQPMTLTFSDGGQPGAAPPSLSDVAQLYPETATDLPFAPSQPYEVAASHQEESFYIAPSPQAESGFDDAATRPLGHPVDSIDSTAQMPLLGGGDEITEDAYNTMPVVDLSTGQLVSEDELQLSPRDVSSQFQSDMEQTSHSMDFLPAEEASAVWTEPIAPLPEPASLENQPTPPAEAVEDWLGVPPGQQSEAYQDDVPSAAHLDDPFASPASSFTASDVPSDVSTDDDWLASPSASPPEVPSPEASSETSPELFSYAPPEDWMGGTATDESDFTYDTDDFFLTLPEEPGHGSLTAEVMSHEGGYGSSILPAENEIPLTTEDVTHYYPQYHELSQHAQATQGVMMPPTPPETTSASDFLADSPLSLLDPLEADDDNWMLSAPEQEVSFGDSPTEIHPPLAEADAEMFLSNKADEHVVWPAPAEQPPLAVPEMLSAEEETGETSLTALFEESDTEPHGEFPQWLAEEDTFTPVSESLSEPVSSTAIPHISEFSERPAHESVNGSLHRTANGAGDEPFLKAEPEIPEFNASEFQTTAPEEAVSPLAIADMGTSQSENLETSEEEPIPMTVQAQPAETFIEDSPSEPLSPEQPPLFEKSLTPTLMVQIVPKPQDTEHWVLIQVVNPQMPAQPANVLRELPKHLVPLNPAEIEASREAKLRSKTIYRLEMGRWKGIFSQEADGSVAFRDELLVGG